MPNEGNSSIALHFEKAIINQIMARNEIFYNHYPIMDFFPCFRTTNKQIGFTWMLDRIKRRKCSGIKCIYLQAL